MRCVGRRAAFLLFIVMAGACRSTGDLRLPPSLEPFARDGAAAVEVHDVAWKDSARNVVIRARIYSPADTSAHALVLFSHGLGNSRFGYSYLGRHWASWGIISVHIEHPGAGEDLARRGFVAVYRAGFDPQLDVSTVRDAHFVIDELTGRDVPGFLRGRVRADAIGVAGHSLGAYVALATAGAIRFLPIDPALTLRDRRVRAAVALSMSENLPSDVYGQTEVPILHFTGTSDSSFFYGTTKRMRRIPFEHTSGGVAWLVTLRGANHSTFSADDRSATPVRIDAIKALTLLWWKAWLEGDDSARKLLASPAIGDQLRAIGTLERR